MTYESAAAFAQTSGLLYFVGMFAAVALYAFWPRNRARFDPERSPAEPSVRIGLALNAGCDEFCLGERLAILVFSSVTEVLLAFEVRFDRQYCRNSSKWPCHRTYAANSSDRYGIGHGSLLK